MNYGDLLGWQDTPPFGMGTPPGYGQGNDMIGPIYPGMGTPPYSGPWPDDQSPYLSPAYLSGTPQQNRPAPPPAALPPAPAARPAAATPRPTPSAFQSGPQAMRGLAPPQSGQSPPQAAGPWSSLPSAYDGLLNAIGGSYDSMLRGLSYDHRNQGIPDAAPQMGGGGVMTSDVQNLMSMGEGFF